MDDDDIFQSYISQVKDSKSYNKCFINFVAPPSNDYLYLFTFPFYNIS